MSPLAWPAYPDPYDLSSWEREAEAALADPGRYGAPQGDGEHEEILIPLRIEDNADFVGRYSRKVSDTGDEIRIAEITFGRAPLPGEGTALFALLRIPRRGTDGVSRCITAVIHLDDDPDDLMSDDDEAYASINTALFDLTDMTAGTAKIITEGKGIIDLTAQRQRMDLAVSDTPPSA